MLHCKSAVCHVSVVSVVLASVVMMVSNVVQSVRSIPVQCLYSHSVMTLHRSTQTQVPRSPHKSAKSVEKSPEPRWVAHCLDSFTEQRQENSVPQF